MYTLAFRSAESSNRQWKELPLVPSVTTWLDLIPLTFRVPTTLLGLIALAMVTTLPTSGPLAATINFPDFSEVSGLSLNGDTFVSDSALRLTPAINSRAGSAFTTQQFFFADGFSTHFEIQIGGHAGPAGDGLAFVLQAADPTALGGGGGLLGYEGIGASVAIEFDTIQNLDRGDPQGSHVSVLSGGTTDHNLLTFSPVVLPFDLTDGVATDVWVDYDSVGGLLEVRVSRDGVRPQDSTVAEPLEMALLVGFETAFFGFSSGTGAANDNHDVLSWSLATVPEPSTVILLATGLVGLAWRGRKRLTA